MLMNLKTPFNNMPAAHFDNIKNEQRKFDLNKTFNMQLKFENLAIIFYLVKL